MSYRFKSRSSRPRKYQRGAPLLGWAEFKGLYRLWQDDHARPVFLWLGQRPEHIAYTANRSAIWLDFMINSERICHAELTDEYREWVAKEAREAFPSEGPVPVEDAA